MKSRLLAILVVTLLTTITLASFALSGVNLKASNNNDSVITPNSEFFTTAIDYFEIDPEEYRLTVTGAVKNTLTFTLDEIKSITGLSEVVRLTCVAYKSGATSMTGVANFTGVRLSYFLDLAEINYNIAKDISFHTPDPDGYSTSLNLTEAYWDDVILAYEMNGEPLPVDHGFPVRLVCPRFYGYKWIKWLANINIETKDYVGFWEGFGYSDSPYVDVDLPIYYNETDISATSTTSPTSSSMTSSKTSETDALATSTTPATPWLTFDVFVLATIVFTGYKIVLHYSFRKRRNNK
ncbi:MAG: molybdopterin-dependent oxidoreductase [Candidatus Odinarchaeota archaeon]